jgi:hypothetical protein
MVEYKLSDFEKFCEQSDIKYHLVVTVNGEVSFDKVYTDDGFLSEYDKKREIYDATTVELHKQGSHLN